MATVEVLVEGYAFRRGAAIQASSSVCLIRTEAGKLILTDPGCNRHLLAEALSIRHLAPEEINYVFLTHHHYDHLALAAWFDEAIIIPCENGLIYTQDEMIALGKESLGEDIEILQTPGHCEEHQSLLAHTKEGTLSIAGDVFWFWNDSKTPAESGYPGDDAPNSIEKLRQSREILLTKSSIIIPGHGKACTSESLRALLGWRT